MKVGTGNREYEVVENWPTMPESATWGQVVEIVVDSADRVFVFHRGETSPMIFNTAGEYQGTWENAGQWKDIHGVTIASDDDGEFLIVVDRDRHVVCRTTLDGEVVWTLGTPDEPHKDGNPFYRPTDSAVAPNGDVYITDGYGNARVHQYTSSGEHIRSWGSRGVGPGQFNLPHGVRIAERNGEPVVYVCDRENHRIQLFTLDGTYITKLTGFKQPGDMVVDGDGVRYVAELQHRIAILDENDREITRIGGESKSEPGHFVAPHTVWFDSEGSLYVGEVLEGQRVSKFKRV
jgi:sugar lactone lactonase YvrE